MSMLLDCHPPDPQTVAYHTDEATERWPRLRIITIDGGSYPSTHYAWCGICGSFWDEGWTGPIRGAR